MLRVLSYCMAFGELFAREARFRSGRRKMRGLAFNLSAGIIIIDLRLFFNEETLILQFLRREEKHGAICVDEDFFLFFFLCV